MKYVATVGTTTKTFTAYKEAVDFIRLYWFYGLVWQIVKMENGKVLCGD